MMTFGSVSYNVVHTGDEPVGGCIDCNTTKRKHKKEWGHQLDCIPQLRNDAVVNSPSILY